MTFRQAGIAFAQFFAALLFYPSIDTLADDAEPLTLESIYASDAFALETLGEAQWRADDKAFTFARRNRDTGLLDIYQYDVAGEARERLLVAGDTLVHQGTPIRMSTHQWSADRKYLLIKGPDTLLWDGSYDAPYYLYTPETGELRPLSDGDPGIRNATLSPDGARVAYVQDHNIHMTELASGATKRITTDGNANILNGAFDYVTGQAFSNLNGMRWSPDGSKLAFWRLDITEMKVFHLVDKLGGYNEIRSLKYPNVGEKNAVPRIAVYDLASGVTTWMDIGDNTDIFIPRLVWTHSKRLLSLQRLNRAHNRLEIMLGDTETGKTRVIHTETDPAWVDITDDLIFLRKRNQFVWTSERDGYRHAYLFGHDGNLIRQLTHGDWEISTLIGLDEATGWLYFDAKKDGFTDQHVYRVRLDGTTLQKLSDKPGWHDWRLSPRRAFAIATISDIHTPPQISLRKADGKKINIIEENKIPAMTKYRLARPEFLKVKTSDGVELNAVMIKPSHFDPARKYPVIAYGYGNAGSQVVVNRWGDVRHRWLWHRFMAEQGFIIFALDNRTTAGRGKAAKNLTYGHYAKYAINDQIEGAKYLAGLPYVDASRIGFWGWSGGGYLAVALMTKGAPHFKTAISIAPVIDLSRYQSIGVERWMGTPENNPDGYHATNLLNFVDLLKGNLLLIHGTGDENVKSAFTMQLVNELIAANKPFDLMLYPNRHHGLQDALLHVFSTMTAYFQENL